MDIGKFNEYKGFIGSIELTEGKHHGILLNTNDFVNYTADSLEELEEEFHKAVDDYLIVLEELSLIITKDNYRILIDSKEFQQKVLDYIGSEEIDKMIRSTIFDGKPECKSAIIHGMCIASMLASYCEPFCIIEKSK